ncbi:hypothetical protein Goshw_001681 [Gossypium schwendimanii]|uniref:Uncharacterized protein n=1 Tax=Gossypium schwendimanii TaxID=34291 RepID=A0A7J9LK35_GOSSC|nr:hypothetical protein [Gossypium schwendimanii]
MVTRLIDIFQVEARAMLEGLKIAWDVVFVRWKWRVIMLF